MLISATLLRGSLITRGAGVRLLPPHARLDCWPTAAEVLTVYAVRDDSVYLVDGDGDRWDAALDLVQLDLQDAVTVHHVADVLRREGHEMRDFLPWALGGKCPSDVFEVYVPGDAARCRAEPPICEDGRIRCYAVAGHAGEHLTAPTRHRVRESAMTARLLAASVAGVAAGTGAVRGLRGAWAEILPGQWTRPSLIGASDPLIFVLMAQNSLARGWRVGRTSGPETGSAGRAAADAALLTRGYAYLDERAPCGVQVPFLGAAC